MQLTEFITIKNIPFLHANTLQKKLLIFYQAFIIMYNYIVVELIRLLFDLIKLKLVSLNFQLLFSY